jgi:hypothetical protein
MMAEAMHPENTQTVRDALAPVLKERDQRQYAQLSDRPGFGGDGETGFPSLKEAFEPERGVKLRELIGRLRSLAVPGSTDATLGSLVDVVLDDFHKYAAAEMEEGRADLKKMLDEEQTTFDTYQCIESNFIGTLRLINTLHLRLQEGGLDSKQQARIQELISLAEFDLQLTYIAAIVLFAQFLSEKQRIPSVHSTYIFPDSLSAQEQYIYSRYSRLAEILLSSYRDEIVAWVRNPDLQQRLEELSDLASGKPQDAAMRLRRVLEENDFPLKELNSDFVDSTRRKLSLVQSKLDALIRAFRDNRDNPGQIEEAFGVRDLFREVLTTLGEVIYADGYNLRLRLAYIVDADDVAQLVAPETQDAASAPSAGTMAPQDDGKGGIDLRRLPTAIQAQSGRAPILSSEASSGSDPEWQEIQNMLNSGIIPSVERIKEYLQAACDSKDCLARTERTLALLADILRLEEENCFSTDISVKELLALLEANNSIETLQTQLNRINISWKEPVTLEQ